MLQHQHGFGDTKSSQSQDQFRSRPISTSNNGENEPAIGQSERGGSHMTDNRENYSSNRLPFRTAHPNSSSDSDKQWKSGNNKKNSDYEEPDDKGIREDKRSFLSEEGNTSERVCESSSSFISVCKI